MLTTKWWIEMPANAADKEVKSVETSVKTTEELDPFVRRSKPISDTLSNPSGVDDGLFTAYARSPLEIVPIPRPIGSRLPRTWQPIEHFSPIANWEGVVIEVREDFIVARVIDPEEKNDKGETTLEIPIEDIAEGDRPLVTEGAIFYLTIGYRQIPGQPRRKDATLIFRRLPGWTKKRLAEAKEFAGQLSKILNSD